nr:ribosomal protein S18-alanine N-acetyltransferase [Hasllibacter sp. MH4015]
MRALLDQPTTRAVVGETGFALLQIIVPEAELLTLAVEPDQRRHGLGRALLQQAMQDAARSGADTIVLEVDAGNAPALTLYDSEGFQRIAVRQDYYRHADGRRSDAIVMSRALNQGT